MNYRQALSKTQLLPRLGQTPGLACLRQLLHKLGDPQEKVRYVHVAGTNGKGSVCAMLASVLQAAGYRAGLYTSPYLVDFRERFQCDGKTISREDYARLFTRVMAAADGSLSQFDVITAVAFCWYAEQAPDVVVLETGMGGRLDATNVITRPLVSVITSVSLDHTAILGNTVAAIASEKAGIIKPGCPVVLAPDLHPEAAAVIRQAAANAGCEWCHPDYTLGDCQPEGTSFFYRNEPYTTALAGRVQAANAAAVLATAECLQKQGFVLPVEAVRRGLGQVVHPARCQILRRQPLLILDGAHNPDGAAKLAETLQNFSAEKFMGVCGMMADKSVTDVVKAMAPMLASVVTVTPENPRALPAEELAELFAPYCAARPAKLSRELLDTVKQANVPAVIFGSLYLAGEVLRIEQGDSQVEIAGKGDPQ